MNTTSQNDVSATLAAHEHEINPLVYRLFHLTPSAIALIESSFAG